MNRVCDSYPRVEIQPGHDVANLCFATLVIGSVQEHPRPVTGRNEVHCMQHQVDTLVFRIEATEPQHVAAAATVPYRPDGSLDSVLGNDHVTRITQGAHE